MIERIITKAGLELKKHYQSLSGCNVKEKFHLVTESDLYIEKMIIQDLKTYYPDYSIFSEEAGNMEIGSGKRWIIDPIDGTADFVFGVPYFAISGNHCDKWEIRFSLPQK